MRYLFMMIIMLYGFPVQSASGWTDYGHVVELVPTIHFRFKVKIDVSGNKSACREKYWFYQDYNASGSREMYLALLEAVSSNKLVRVYVTGRCDINEYSEISELGIRP